LWRGLKKLARGIGARDARPGGRAERLARGRCDSGGYRKGRHQDRQETQVHVKKLTKKHLSRLNQKILKGKMM